MGVLTSLSYLRALLSTSLLLLGSDGFISKTETHPAVYSTNKHLFLHSLWSTEKYTAYGISLSCCHGRRLKLKNKWKVSLDNLGYLAGIILDSGRAACLHGSVYSTLRHQASITSFCSTSIFPEQTSTHRAGNISDDKNVNEVWIAFGTFPVTNTAGR